MPSKVNPKTRIFIEIGYTKFVLPEGTSADAMAVLASAVPVNTQYGNGRHHIYPEYDQKRIEVKIIDAGEIKNFIDVRGDEHPDYDIIINEVKDALADKNHGAVIFDSTGISACGKRLEYTDMADPDFNPQKLIGEIVEAALKHPSRI